MERALDIRLSKTSTIVEISKETSLPEEYRIPMGQIYDQGSSSMCAVYALSDLIARGYDVSKPFDLKEFYNHRTTKEGMALDELMDIGANHGFNSKEGNFKLREFFRVGTVDSIKKAIVSMFGVVAGMPVYSYDSNFWKSNGKLLGYHAVSLIGYDKHGLILKNSWGSSWGNNGYSTIPYSDVQDSVIEAWALI